MHDLKLKSRLRTDREDLHLRYWQSVRNFEDQAKRLEADRLEHPFYEDRQSDYLRHAEICWCHNCEGSPTTQRRRPCSGDRDTTANSPNAMMI